MRREDTIKRAHGRLLHEPFWYILCIHRVTLHSNSVNALRGLKIQCIEKKAVGVRAKGAITAFEFHECGWFDAAFECQLTAGKPLVKAGSADSGNVAE